jgi:hypothetical protein
MSNNNNRDHKVKKTLTLQESFEQDTISISSSDYNDYNFNNDDIIIKPDIAQKCKPDHNLVNTIAAGKKKRTRSEENLEVQEINYHENLEVQKNIKQVQIKTKKEKMDSKFDKSLEELLCVTILKFLMRSRLE